MSLDRRAGMLRINGSMANFVGRCSPYDPRTSHTREAAPQRSGRSSHPSGPSSAAGSDSRSAARAMAGRANSRDMARSSAIKADLAFRLFNAGNIPIVELVMIGTNGMPSKNWLRPGERIPAQTFRSMNFAAGRSCNHRVRITYADGTRALQPIDFCGKDVLYANGRDIWAE
jgi:hypothetical protein